MNYDNPNTIKREKEKIFGPMYENAVSYWGNISQYVIGFNPREYEIVNNCVSSIKSNHEGLLGLEFDSANVLGSSAKIYDLYGKIHYCLSEIHSAFTNEYYYKLSSQNKSSTFNTESIRERNKFLIHYENYTDQDKDAYMLNWVIDNLPDRDTVFSFVVDNQKQINKLVIKLAGYLVAQLVGTQKKEIETIINTQKDLALGAERIDVKGLKGIHSLLVRYNLTPLSGAIHLSRIFSEMDLKYNPNNSLEENMKLITTKGPGVIFINISNKSPLIFDIRGLIDERYIEQMELKTDIMAGLTKRVLLRFNTTYFLPQNTTEQGDTVIFPGSWDEYYVLVTNNGKNWRYFGINGDKLIPRAALKGILDKPTGRPHYYNNIQEEIIIGDCFEPNSVLMLTEYANSLEAKSSGAAVESKIIEELMKSYTTRAANKTVNDITTLRELSYNLDDISKILFNILLPKSVTTGKGVVEGLITYIGKIEAISWALSKEIIRQWDTIEIPKRLFLENSGNELNRVILKTLEFIFTKAMKELEDSRTWTDYDTTLKEFYILRKQLAL
jgi:hypothetical protein